MAGSLLKARAPAVPEYHQSAINMFLKCGKQWFFRYVDGIKTPPSAALTVGSAVDAAITRNFILKKEKGEDSPLEEVLDTYSTDFEIRAGDTEWGEDDRGVQKDVGAQCLTIHHKEIAPHIKPVAVQEAFVIETDAGYNLGGTLDVVDAEDFCRDSKTAKAKYDDDAISRAVQPALYDFAFETLRGRSAKGFAYDVMIKPTKTLPARSQVVKGTVTAGDREWLFGAIEQMHKAILAGVALPAPDGAWWCSAKWCGYWNICKGRK